MKIWDQENSNYDVSEKIFLWRSYNEKKNVFSIPGYLEDNAERLRNKYISFVYDLGKSHLRKKSIISHLDLGDGLSLWWMSLLSEKSPFKSPKIYQCLRLLALEEILIAKKPRNLILVSSDKSLFLAIERLCQNLSIKVNWQKCKTEKDSNNFRKIYHNLPHTLQGLFSFRHLLLKYSLKRVKKSEWFSGNKNIFFCSYFFNLDQDLGSKGTFFSRQWGDLPYILNINGIHTNWAHHFLKSPDIPNPKVGLDLVNKFNRHPENQGIHSFIESFITLKVSFEIIKKWILLNHISFRLRKVHKLFTVKDSSVWLWPLLGDDWKKSLTGTVAFNNCLNVVLFDKIFRAMPYQKRGLYLWENQAWEVAMIHSWRRYNHGEIVGVPHATICFWHLNNFDDNRIFTHTKFSKPLPNFLAINGVMARDALDKSGYLSERIVEVEALRFNYLEGMKENSFNSVSNVSTHNKNQKPLKNVLILGDINIAHTHKMLKLFEKAIETHKQKFNVVLKPHPACPLIKINDYPDLLFKITDKPIDKILKNFDTAFVSNSTSAGIDALISGLKVAIFLDGNDFNHSPLRSDKIVYFVNSPEALSLFLEEGLSEILKPDVKDYFWVNSNYSKWKRFLGLEVN
jgi:surface carbohydrate biosynthesis protein (TIGR04326 family)